MGISQRYYNQRWDFSCVYPVDWEIAAENEPAAPWEIALAVASPDHRAGFLVNARRSEVLFQHHQISIGPDGQAIQEPTSPQEFIQVQCTSLAHAFRNLTFHTGTEITWLGRPATRITYSYDGDQERRQELCLTWFGVGMTFQLIGEAPAADFASWEPAFEQILSGFRIGKGEDVPLPEPAAAAEMTPTELYNAGVALQREARYAEAKEFFRRCYRSGAYTMQAAYAEGLCDRALGRQPRIPPELVGRESETGVVYVASNLACYLIREGRRAALVKAGPKSEIAAMIRGTRYLVQTSTHPLFESFEHYVYRLEGESRMLLYPLAQGTLTETDKDLVAKVEHASTLPLSPLPPEGLATSAPWSHPAAELPTPAEPEPPPAPQEARREVSDAVARSPEEYPPIAPVAARAEPGGEEAPVPRGVPRRPGAIALLNLTGLGLGYLWLRCRVRWGLHLAITLGLIAGAFLTGAAAYNAALWLPLFGVWLLWMAVDGWRQARRRRDLVPAEALVPAWQPLVAVGVLVLEAAGLWGYGALERREFAAGMAAYESADCRTAMQHFYRVTTVYELSFSPNVATADALSFECSLMIVGENARKNEAYPEAIRAYEVYQSTYPNGGLGGVARERAAEARSAWAGAFHQAGEYTSAIEQWKIVLGNYADTSTGKEAAASVAAVYADWADALAAEARYADAIQKYEIVLKDYPSTSTGRQAAERAAEVYDTWAVALRSTGAYTTAIEKYEAILSAYPQTTAGSQAGDAIATTRLEWADHLRQEGDHQNAVAQYETVLRSYADTPFAKTARSEASETCLDWAARLRVDKAFQEAITKYQLVLDDYAGTEAAQRAPALRVETYMEWGADLRARQHYAEAVSKYQWLARNDPAAAADAVHQAIGETYIEWGKWHHTRREYILALEKFTLAQEATTDAGVLSAATTGYETAFAALVRDSGADGQRILLQAKTEVCDGKAATSAAVGILEDEAGRALMCEDGAFVLPVELNAIKPGHLRYVVKTETGSSQVGSCPYTGGHTLVRQRQWTRVRVYSVSTGRSTADRTFYGSMPGACPWMRSFFIWSTVEYESGGPPDTAEIMKWLKTVVR